MNWDCKQTEARLSDYLDATLAPAEQQAAELHVAACARCVEWRDARRAVVWLERVEPLPVPPGLETRILAWTTGATASPTFWETLASGWRGLGQPRVALSLASALVSFSLLLQVLGIDLRRVSARDFHPANVYRKLDRSAHVAYGHGVKFINDLRLVYEIRSRLDELKPEAAEPAEPAPATPEKKPQKNFTEDGSTRPLYVYHETNPVRYTR